MNGGWEVTALAEEMLSEPVNSDVIRASRS